MLTQESKPNPVTTFTSDNDLQVTGILSPPDLRLGALATLVRLSSFPRRCTLHRVDLSLVCT